MRFLAISDTHLRGDKPRCRTDNNWIESQQEMMDEIAHIANHYKCPIIHAGDVFNRAVVSVEVMNIFIDFCKKLEKPIYVLPGNHDLPYHSFSLLQKSSIGVILNLSELTEKVKSMDSFSDISYANFGEEITNPNTDILVMHRLVFPNSNSVPPNVDAITAKELLDFYPNYRCIITGDCHIPFVYTSNDGRMVINPGHTCIQKINELDSPSVYVVEITENGVKANQILLSDHSDLVTDEFVKQQEEREDKIEAFVERIKTNESFSLSFIDNIENSILENKKELDDDIIILIRDLIQGEQK